MAAAPLYRTMDEPILIALISALGIKEIWNIIKKRMDQKNDQIKREDNLSLKVIEELRSKLKNLEEKQNILIEENTALKIKVARMEERIIKSAAHSKKRK
jgi:outer membrane murein-binding lipoprotein Lpp